ncbi:putative serine--pyruvate aminotransferase-like [Sesbania bispinosa]|nr:putative serine--pyruvate aminotransferase-like [Sesbania bispinosa]
MWAMPLLHSMATANGHKRKYMATFFLSTVSKLTTSFQHHFLPHEPSTKPHQPLTNNQCLEGTNQPITNLITTAHHLCHRLSTYFVATFIALAAQCPCCMGSSDIIACSSYRGSSALLCLQPTVVPRSFAHHRDRTDSNPIAGVLGGRARKKEPVVALIILGGRVGKESKTHYPKGGLACIREKIC